MKIIINCKSCNNQLKGKQTLFCSVKCKNKFHQCYPAQKQRALIRKLKLVKMVGSKCKKCGYNKNLASLVFHHLKSQNKDFKLDARSLSNRTFESIEKEFKKCILLCHNCHHELHNPELNLDSKRLSRLL